jgi:hypothetical protein
MYQSFSYISKKKKSMAEFKLKPKTAEEWLEIITAPGASDMLMRPPLSADEKAEHIRKYHLGQKKSKKPKDQSENND